MKTDEQIKNDVLDELDFDPQVESAAVAVTVHDGVVNLTGHVPNYWQKYAAERAARRVNGVRALAQDILVQLDGQNPVGDEEIARRAANIMAWNVTPPKKDVEVRVDNGWVTLQGEVNWAYQRQSAEQAVRQLTGVKGVINNIAVKSDHEAQDISASIKRAFERNADIDATAVKVVVDGHAVTLSGRVQAWSERRAAEQAAWAAPGVYTVVDQLTVA